MTKGNESITTKKVIFMNVGFFCKLKEPYQKREEIMRHFRLPVVLKDGFCHAVIDARDNLFVVPAISDKKVTRKAIAEAFNEAPFLPMYFKIFNINAERIIETFENKELYSFAKKKNHSEVLDTVIYLHEKGYELILRDDKPESILMEAMRKNKLLEYFSVKGMMGNYLTFSTKSMEELIGSDNPTEIIVVTHGTEKAHIIEAANKMGMPVILCDDYDITSLKDIL